MTFFLKINSTSSGAEMNLKVGEGGTDPERKWEGTDPAQSAGKKIILVMPLHFFLALKVQLVVLVSAFMMVSTVW